MADNVNVTPGSGATLAADDIGGVLYGRTKIVLGADGVNDGDVSDANPLPVAGPLTDAELRATAVPVSGTFWQATQPVSAASLPLPTGAATETTLATLAGVVKAEDSASADGDPGFVVLAQRRDSDSPAVGTDGDYTTLKMDEAGRLKVSTQPASYTATTGNITANGQTVFVECSRFSNLMLHCTGTFSTVNVTFEGSLNSTNGTDGNWFTVQAIRSNANTIETTTGNLSAAPAYAWELSVNGLKYFRVRATAWASGTQTWTMVPGTYATEPIPGAQISGTQPVSGTVTANIGTGSIAAGTNAIGDVGTQYRANATGAGTIAKALSGASTNATVVKASAGRLIGYNLSNTNAAFRYVKLYNVTTAPTAGAGTIVGVIALPPNGTVAVSHPGGIAFTTGISYTMVTGAADNDATGVGANDIVGHFVFA